MKIKFLRQFTFIFVAVLILLPVLSFVVAYQTKSVDLQPKIANKPIFYNVKVVESSFTNQQPVVLSDSIKLSECVNTNSQINLLQGGSNFNLNQPASCFNFAKDINVAAVKTNVVVSNYIVEAPKIFVLRHNEFLFDQIVKPVLPVSGQSQSNLVFSLGLILVVSSLLINRRFLIKKDFNKFKQQLNFYKLCVMRC